MSELKSLIEAARVLRASGEPFVSATVVGVRGSSYRRPGARMLASGEQWVAGSISGGCLERDVLTKGLWRTREAAAVLVSYDQELENDEHEGSGCRGAIDMLVERGQAAQPWDWFGLAEHCVREERAAVLVTVFRSSHAALPVGTKLALTEHGYDGSPGASAHAGAFLDEARRALAGGVRDAYSFEHGGVTALIEPITPPLHLFVFGSGHDATPLLTLAMQLGWSTSVWDAQPRFSARERLRSADNYLTGSLQDAVARVERCVHAAAVVMGHHFRQDAAVLGALLRSRAPYIGVLGPRRRTAELLDELGATPADRTRLHAPVGLQLGAETPSEIALSIAAEIQADLTHMAGRRLRAEPGDIHASRRDVSEHAAATEDLSLRAT